MRGEGVVGEQPVLPPGTYYDYNSFCHLKTAVGTMHGEYTMVTPSGETFEARIAPFHPRCSERTATRWPLLRSGAPSMRRAERSSGGRSAGMEAAAKAGPPAKKKIDSAAAWREFRELLWVHRRRLAIGLTLMMISRLAGIVLPALSKYVIDDVIGKGRARAAGADCAGGGRGDHRPGDHQLRPVADPWRGRAARHHRHAQARPGQGDAAAGALLRLDADRRAVVAHHERRRRHP